jgi:flagellar biosynthetic protein FlhB
LAGEKTEKPTAKRIQDAREKGQVAKSSDFNSAVVLTTAAMAMMYAGPYSFSTIYALMRHTFEQILRSPVALRPLDDAGFNTFLSGTIQSVAWLLLPVLLALMTLGALGNLIQVKPLFAPAAVHPKLDKINPIGGFKRLFSMRAIMETVKALVKMTIIGACGTIIIQKHWTALMGLGGVETAVAWQTVLGVLDEIMQWCCILFLLAGLLDWRYQAWELEKQLRMSRQDIKDERRNQDGDPMIKSRVRQMGIKMAKARQLASVPTADAVITNPTHYAIAIKYDPDVAPAPVVVAKGKDHFAQKIKEVAKAHGVPMVENKPLARALYPVVEAEAMIPPELFVAVAEVLAYIFAKNKGRRLSKRKPDHS